MKYGILKPTEKSWVQLDIANKEAIIEQMILVDGDVDRMMKDMKNPKKKTNIINIADYSSIKGVFKPLVFEDWKKGWLKYTVAWNSRELMGYAQWGQIPNYNMQYCMLSQIYVRSAYRRQGVAKKLIDINIKHIDGILAEVATEARRKLYMKHYPTKIVFGRMYGLEWQPESLGMLQRQARLFDNALQQAKLNGNFKAQPPKELQIR